MNFPDFLRTIWTDPRFQDLDTATKAVLYAALSQVDMAGWWAPNRRLVAVEIPGVDLKAASESLAPWVQTHPTGWWSVRGYVALQCGEGPLNLNSGFAKGVDRLLRVHQKRECAALGGGVYNVEGLGALPIGALPPSDQAGPGGSRVVPGGAPRGGESPKSQVPCPKDPSPEVPSPTRGSGGAAPALEAGPSKLQDVVNLFEQMAPVSVLDVKPWERDALHRAAARWTWERVYGAAGVYFAHGAGPLPSLADFTEKLPKLLALSCRHESKEWWTFPVDPAYPEGVKRKRWRCHACNHSEEREGSDFLPADHEHNYVLQPGSGFVVGATDELQAVASLERCVGAKGCGHARAAQQVQGVAA